LEATYRVFDNHDIGKSQASPYDNFVANAEISSRSHFLGIEEEDFAEGA
jgi:hypothetical protein